MSGISYRTGNDLDLAEVIEVYRDSTLGERRPVSDLPRFEAMLRNANLVVSAWSGAEMVGDSTCHERFLLRHLSL